MSTNSQETVDNTATAGQSGVEAGTLGFSNKDSVAQMFPASPLHLGHLTNVENIYFNGGKHVEDSVEIDGLNGTVIAGHGFSENVSLNYSEAPDMNIAGAGGAGGAPANAYVPNPSSPGGTIGTPNDNPTAKPVPPESFKSMDGFGGATGGGPSAIDANGMPIKPSDTSAAISVSQRSYPRGESSWTSSQKLDSSTPTDANN